MIRELNSFLAGWVTYFRHAAMKSHLVALNGWIRRKLRCVRLKQCKRVKPMVDFLRPAGRVAAFGVVYGVVGEGLVAQVWDAGGDPGDVHELVGDARFGKSRSSV